MFVLRVSLGDCGHIHAFCWWLLRSVCRLNVFVLSCEVRKRRVDAFYHGVYVIVFFFTKRGKLSRDKKRKLCLMHCTENITQILVVGDFHIKLLQNIILIRYD